MSSKPDYQRPRGTYDILPADYMLWHYVIRVFTDLAESAGYGRITTPAIEKEALFVRSVGETSEIISKEIYSFTDKSDNRLALRPEGTAPVVRAYLENGLSSQPKPVKLYLIEPMWRYDRPQAGRYRQFVQVGIENFGSADPIVDAQVIALAARFYRQLGIKYSLQINSLGNEATREGYITELSKYFSKQKNLPETVLAQLATNPLRILDSKEPELIKIVEHAPQIIEFLDEDSSKHLHAALEYLEQFGIDYELNPLLVRGLDYYTGVLFEFWGSNQGQQNAIGGGGRYDNLVAELGGTSTPAVGFGIGLERLMIEMQKAGVAIPVKPKQTYIVTIGDEARTQGLILEQLLLDAGVSTLCELTKKNLGDQLARASKLGVQYAIIIGKKELIDKTAIIKELASGNQEIVPQTKVPAELARRFTR